MHYGVPGMKWGVRRALRDENRAYNKAVKKPSKKNVDKYFKKHEETQEVIDYDAFTKFRKMKPEARKEETKKLSLQEQGMVISGAEKYINIASMFDAGGFAKDDAKKVLSDLPSYQKDKGKKAVDAYLKAYGKSVKIATAELLKAQAEYDRDRKNKGKKSTHQIKDHWLKYE